MYEDTYFLSSQEALRVASEQNRWGDNNYFLQMCYYEGDRIESELENLVHLPIESLVEELAQGRYRIPSKVDFTGLEISADIKLNVLTNFNLSIEHAKNYRQQYNEHYFQTLKQAKPDFSEPLRFYLSASTSTQVMQYVSKNIADAVSKKGYEVLFDLYCGIEDQNSLKRVSEFNPHVTININHINNRFLSNDVFNVVWFQDPMTALIDNTELHLRERDFIYTLSDILMEKKFTKDMYEIQRFCVNERDFYRDESIEKEDKIIFIGSSHAAILSQEVSEHVMDIYYLLKEKLDSGFKITREYLEELSKLNHISYNDLLLTPFAMAVRECSVEWICKQNKIDVEVYGRYWENNPTVAPYFKGEVPHGEDVAKIYNSAKYSVYAHSFDMYQQRLPEIAACGTIPVAFDAIGFKEDGYDYEDSTLLFSNYDELVDILGTSPKKSVYEISEKMMFSSFIDRIIEKIKQKV